MIIVAYDISDEKRLDKVAKVVKNFGIRVQRSVFECHIDKHHYIRLKKDLSKVIDIQKDHISFYNLCKDDINHDLHIGKFRVYKDEDYYLL